MRTLERLIWTATTLTVFGCGEPQQPPASEPKAVAETSPRPAPDPAQEWIDKLDDSEWADRALVELDRLRSPAAIEPLAARWRRADPASRARILRIIIDIADQRDRGPLEVSKGEDVGTAKKRVYGPYFEDGPYWAAALPVLQATVDELVARPDDRVAIENGVVALDALGRAKAFASVDCGRLVSAAELPIRQDAPGAIAHLAAIRALGGCGDDRRAVDALVGLARRDEADVGVQVLAAAVDSLGRTRAPKAVGAILQVLYRVPATYQFCRRALVAIGEPAIEPLHMVLTGRHAEVNALAAELGLATDCNKGMGEGTTCKEPSILQFKAAALLGDLHARAAVNDLLAALGKPPLPAFFYGGTPGPSQHQAIIDALGRIGDSRFAKYVVAYGLDSSSDAEARPLAIDVYSRLTREVDVLPRLARLLRNPDTDSALVMASALAIGRLARRERDLEPLREQIALLTAEAAELKKKGRSDADVAATLDFRRAFEIELGRGAVGIACGDDTTCYVALLSLDRPALIEKLRPWLPGAGGWDDEGARMLERAVIDRALLEIAKSGTASPTTLDALFALLPTTDRVARAGTLDALYRVAPRPCTRCVTALDAIIAAQENQTTLGALTADARVWREYFRWAR